MSRIFVMHQAMKVGATCAPRCLCVSRCLHVLFCVVGNVPMDRCCGAVVACAMCWHWQSWGCVPW